MVRYLYQKQSSREQPEIFLVHSTAHMDPLVGHLSFCVLRGKTFESSRLVRSSQIQTLKSATLQSGSEMNRTLVIPICLAPSIS